VTFLHQWLPKFPLNGAEIALLAYLSSIVVFVSLSLLTSKEPFNLERLLHRGEYADPSEGGTVSDAVPAWQRRLGINAHFTRGDKTIYFLQMGWTAFWLIAFLGATALSFQVGISSAAWLGWWKFVLALSLAVALITIVWFLIGGIRDCLELIRLLRREKPDAADDGWVQ